MTSRKKSAAPGDSLANRLKQRAANDAKRRALVATMARRVANTPVVAAPVLPPPRAMRDAAGTIRAIDSMELYRVGEPSVARRISPEARTLIEAAIAVMNDGNSLALLCWPPHQVCLPAIVDFLVLGDVASSPQKRIVPAAGRVDVVADAPMGLRAAIFPQGRRTHRPAREIQIDRHKMAALQMCHVRRGVYGAGTEPAPLKDYHLVLSRVRQMTGAGKDGRQYAEYEHPILDEIVPYGSPTRTCSENGSLLWRTKSKTDLGKFARNGSADRPAEARFFLYELSPDELNNEVAAIGRAPDLFLLDLSKSGQARLGRNWVSQSRRAVEAMQAAYPMTGILALTDDPWSCEAVRFEVLAGHSNDRARRPVPAASRVVYAPGSSLLDNDASSTAILFAGGVRIVADGFTGQLEAALSSLKSIAGSLEERGNPVSATAARDIITKLRRNVCLPGSLHELSDFLERETTDAIAADNMASYRISAELAALSDPRYGATQVAADELSAAKFEASRLVRLAETATPMGSLLEDKLGAACRASSRTIVVLRNEMIADFARDRFGRIFDKLQAKLESDVIRLTTRQGLSDLVAFAPNFRNQFKRAIIVAPTRQSALEVLSQPWLPDEVAILADADTLRFAARDADRLAAQIDHAHLKERLKRFAAAANTRVGELGAHVVAFDASVRPSEDVDFPDGSVIDLAGPQRGDRQLVELEMESGQRILARHRTGLVQRDDSHSVRRFVETAAGDVTTGDEICVIGPRFIEKARTLLNITAAAAEEIRDYHELVRKRFSELPASGSAARLRLLCQRMGEPTIPAATARYWIDLEDEVEKPLHDVVAHAPRDRAVFMRFAKALEIGPQLAQRFWAWAVIAQRSSRVRAGAAFHDAYKGILTDQHSALAANKERTAEIRALRTAADEYVSRVRAVKKTGKP